MTFRRILGISALSLSLLAGAAFAQDKDKATKQAEVVKSTSTALDKFYAAKPELKAAVAKAPGYGVFTTYGVSFLIGGAGGKGVVHDNKTKKNTYMDMAAASAGLQISADQTDMLIVFKTAAAMTKFIDKGWTVSNNATVSAGAGGKTVGGGEGSTALEDADSYTMTKNGLNAGLAVGGAKFWKDKDLN
jgi:lipid-binding SYLF domain-containing protein